MTDESKKSDDAGWTPPPRKFNYQRFLHKLENVFNEASSWAEMFHKCVKEPTVFNFAKTGFDVANKLQQFILINYYDYFQGWSNPYSEDYNFAVHNVLKHLPYAEKMTQDPNLSLRCISFEHPGIEKPVELYYCINLENETISAELRRWAGSFS